MYNNPKIFDCFTFFNELDLLEIRLEEHAPFVDYFVLSEAVFNHRGKEKTLLFDQNKKRFQRFADKIIHVVVDKKPDKLANETEYQYYWRLENLQRDVLFNHLHGSSENDILMVSDLDEISSQSFFKTIKSDKILYLAVQQIGFYYLNLVEHRPYKIKDRLLAKLFFEYKKKYYERRYWLGTKATAIKNVKSTLSQLRNKTSTFYPTSTWSFVEDGGWHFTYMGGLEKIKEKLKAFAHSEMDFYSEDAQLENLFQNGINFTNKKSKLVPDLLCQTLPISIQSNKEKYKHLLLPNTPV